MFETLDTLITLSQKVCTFSEGLIHLGLTSYFSGMNYIELKQQWLISPISTTYCKH